MALLEDNKIVAGGDDDDLCLDEPWGDNEYPETLPKEDTSNENMEITKKEKSTINTDFN